MFDSIKYYPDENACQFGLVWLQWADDELLEGMVHVGLCFSHMAFL